MTTRKRGPSGTALPLAMWALAAALVMTVPLSAYGADSSTIGNAPWPPGKIATRILFEDKVSGSEQSYPAYFMIGFLNSERRKEHEDNATAKWTGPYAECTRNPPIPSDEKVLQGKLMCSGYTFNKALNELGQTALPQDPPMDLDTGDFGRMISDGYVDNITDLATANTGDFMMFGNSHFAFVTDATSSKVKFWSKNQFEDELRCEYGVPSDDKWTLENLTLLEDALWRPYLIAGSPKLLAMVDLKGFGNAKLYRFKSRLEVDWKYYLPEHNDAVTLTKSDDPYLDYWYDKSDDTQIYRVARVQDDMDGKTLPLEILRLKDNKLIQGGYAEWSNPGDAIHLKDWDVDHTEDLMRDYFGPGSMDLGEWRDKYAASQLILTGTYKNDTVTLKRPNRAGRVVEDYQDHLILKRSSPVMFLESLKYKVELKDEAPRGCTDPAGYEDLTNSSDVIPIRWKEVIGDKIESLDGRVEYNFPVKSQPVKFDQDTYLPRPDLGPLNITAKGVFQRTADMVVGSTWVGVEDVGKFEHGLDRDNDDKGPLPYFAEIKKDKALAWFLRPDNSECLEGPEICEYRLIIRSEFKGKSSGDVCLQAVYKMNGNSGKSNPLSRGTKPSQFPSSSEPLPTETTLAPSQQEIPWKIQISPMVPGGKPTLEGYFREAPVVVSEHMLVKPGDRIDTSESGVEVTVTVPGANDVKAYYWINKGALLNFEQKQMVEQWIDKEVKFLLEKGKIKAQSLGSYFKVASITIETPVATIMVVNTLYTVEHDIATEITTVEVEQGSVRVVPLNTSLSPVTLQAGERVQIGKSSLSPVAAVQGSSPGSSTGSIATSGTASGSQTAGASSSTTSAPPIFVQPVGPWDELGGFWQDDNGTWYRIRQIGTDVYWIMDGQPEVSNVFRGTLTGDRLIGEWVDMPGGKKRGSGKLRLVVHGDDHMTKESNGTYGATEWRRGTPPQGICSSTPVCTSAVEGGSSGVAATPGGTTTPGGTATPGGTTATSTETPGAPPEPKDCPCGLGSEWKIVYQLGNYWSATLTRRGDSDVFDMNARTAAAGYQLVVRLNVDGTQVTGSGTDYKGNPVITSWTGTVGGKASCEAKHCCSVSGSWQQISWPYTVHYKGRISCVGQRSSTGGSGTGGEAVTSAAGGSPLPGGNLPLCGVVTPPATIPPATEGRPSARITKLICDNPRTSKIMDFWLSRAVPIPRQEPSGKLCFEQWGRVVGVSATANIETVTHPASPTTSKSRCEWLWEDSAGANRMDDAKGIMGNFHEFVWNNIWSE